jgi:hypothetical protein
MAKKVQDIQAVIEQRASNKLDKDMETMCNTVQRFDLLRNIDDGQRPEVFAKYPAEGTQAERYIGFSVPALFNGEVERNGNFSGSKWIKDLRNYWLTEYIQRETKDFFERLDRLENDVKDLMDSTVKENDY